MITDWLKKNKHLLSVTRLENAAGIPVDTLHKYLQGKQKLPDKWRDKLEEFVITNINFNK